MEEVKNTILSTLQNRQTKMENMIEFKRNKSSGSVPSISKQIETTYDGISVKVDFLLRYEGEKHRMEYREGQFEIRVDVKMGDTRILTDIKPSLYDLSESLMPDKEPIVNQDYPTGTLSIRRNVSIEELEELVSVI
jgi:hypothetical protein